VPKIAVDFVTEGMSSYGLLIAGERFDIANLQYTGKSFL
jgi:hypothetical protein